LRKVIIDGDWTTFFRILSNGQATTEELIAQDRDGLTCVHMAALEGQSKILARLLQMPAVVSHTLELRDKNGWTPLLCAASMSSSNAHLDCAQLLLNAGASAVCRTENHSTPLHYLVRASADSPLLTAVLHQAVKRSGTEAVNAVNVNGHTPLHEAAICGTPDTVSFLLRHGADPNVRNKFDDPPLAFAERLQRRQIVSLLGFSTPVHTQPEQQVHKAQKLSLFFGQAPPEDVMRKASGLIAPKENRSPTRSRSKSLTRKQKLERLSRAKRRGAFRTKKVERVLNFSHQDRDRFPLNELQQLQMDGTSWKKIQLNNNCIREIPSGQFFEAIKGTQLRYNLTVLNLSANQLSSLPPELGLLLRLRRLLVQHNALTSLPSGVGVLESLEELNASHNKLAFLPLELVGCTKLKSLNVKSNPLEMIPRAVLSKGTASILRYLASEDAHKHIPPMPSPTVRKRMQMRRQSVSSTDDEDGSKLSRMNAAKLASLIVGKSMDLKEAFTLVLSNKNGYQSFLEMLEREFSSENLLFYVSCAKYVQLNADELAEEAENLYQHFIMEDAAMEINIPALVRNEILRTLANVSVVNDEGMRSPIVSPLLSPRSSVALSPSHSTDGISGIVFVGTGVGVLSSSAELSSPTQAISTASSSALSPNLSSPRSTSPPGTLTPDSATTSTSPTLSTAQTHTVDDLSSPPSAFHSRAADDCDEITLPRSATCVGSPTSPRSPLSPGSPASPDSGATSPRGGEDLGGLGGPHSGVVTVDQLRSVFDKAQLHCYRVLLKDAFPRWLTTSKSTFDRIVTESETETDTESKSTSAAALGDTTSPQKKSRAQADHDDEQAVQDTENEREDSESKSPEKEKRTSSSKPKPKRFKSRPRLLKRSLGVGSSSSSSSTGAPATAGSGDK